MQACKRPKHGRVLHTHRCGPSKYHLELLKDTKEHAYYLERPSNGGPLFDRTWNYLLYRGNQPFCVGKMPLFLIRRNQSDACMEFYGPDNELVFTLEWADKGGAGALAAASKDHCFYWKGRRYLWKEKTQLTRTDFCCVDASTGDVAAYFRTVMRPQTKEGKLEFSSLVTDEDFEARIVATMLAYREWAIRRTMRSFFNQTGEG